ncbi:hypothetical protein FA13DRAFT_1031886 [Coprinellus micaceus]|uniref:Uncharacterized protein n=1 Tax=Coprinellus micaceus TaxID=71717 RepID=A0A4Y7RN46_COPMI|nr:hypothetical protein FA13DRAFT_1031886 [Coprinellus micaceus]
MPVPSSLDPRTKSNQLTPKSKCPRTHPDSRQPFLVLQTLLYALPLPLFALCESASRPQVQMSSIFVSAPSTAKQRVLGWTQSIAASPVIRFDTASALWSSEPIETVARCNPVCSVSPRTTGIVTSSMRFEFQSRLRGHLGCRLDPRLHLPSSLSELSLHTPLGVPAQISPPRCFSSRSVTASPRARGLPNVSGLEGVESVVPCA